MGVILAGSICDGERKEKCPVFRSGNGGAGLDAVQPETGNADAGGQACACRGAPGTWAGLNRPSPGGSAPGQKEPRTRAGLKEELGTWYASPVAAPGEGSARPEACVGAPGGPGPRATRGGTGR